MYENSKGELLDPMGMTNPYLMNAFIKSCAIAIGEMDEKGHNNYQVLKAEVDRRLLEWYTLTKKD